MLLFIHHPVQQRGEVHILVAFQMDDPLQFQRVAARSVRSRPGRKPCAASGCAAHSPMDLEARPVQAQYL